MKTSSTKQFVQRTIDLPGSPSVEYLNKICEQVIKDNPTLSLSDFEIYLYDEYISYCTLETDEEFKERLDRSEWNEKLRLDYDERQTYERLKQKFEKENDHE